MFRKPVFWVIFLLLNIFAIFFIYHNLPRALSLIEIETTMSRSASLQAADSLHTFLGIDLQDYRQATSFTTDFWFQSYVELKGGGKEAFREILQGDDYEPYYWQIRHFKEGETREVWLKFTPTGEPLGFWEKVPESEEGPALSRGEAKNLADSLAQSVWNVDLLSYKLIEEAQEERPNGRVDHTFTYEKEGVQVGEAFYRLRMTVSGDRLTTLSREVKVPDSFTREFIEMRSFNNTLASVASGLATVLYGIAIIIWFIVLIRQKQLILKPALIWAIVIGIFFLAFNLNDFSYNWFGYNTENSASTFIIQNLLMTFLSALAMAAFFLMTILIAEAVTRKANPGQVQFWRLADRDVAPTKTVLGYVLGAYLTVPVFMAVTIGFYIFSATHLGWWIPSNILTNPGIMGSFSPAIGALGVSIWAGFWEEAMFRAIPLATMAIIGTKLKKRTLFLIIGIILQAFIFSAAHANYAQQPFYARLVELIIPSLMFAFLYLKVSLLSAVLVHFAYNALWGSLAFFTMRASGLWFDRVLFLFCFFLPLLYVLFRRWQSKKWGEVPPEKLNAASRVSSEDVQLFQEAGPTTTLTADIAPQPEEKIKEKLLPKLVFALFVIITGTLFFSTSGRPADFPELRMRITADRAMEIAGVALEEWLGEEIPAVFNAYPRIFTADRTVRYFLLSRNGKEAYREMLGTYLFENSWHIEYKRFEGTLQERREHYWVLLTPGGEPYHIRHIIAEDEPGAELSEDEARILVMQKLAELPNYQDLGLKEISAVPRKQPERMDWNFTFTDTLSTLMEQGEPRLMVSILGDYPAAVSRFVFIPEEDNREISALDRKTFIIQVLAYLLLAILAGFCLGTAFLRLTHKQLDFALFWKVFLLMVILIIIDTVISWRVRIGGFYTLEPYSNQMIALFVGTVLQAIFPPALLALLFAYVRSWQVKREPRPLKASGIFSMVIAGLLALIILPFLTGETASIANILKLPDFSPVLTTSPLLSILVSLTRLFLLLFGLGSYFFYLIEKLLSKGVSARFFAYLMFILAGLSLSVVMGFPYFTAPFTWLLLLRGLFIALNLYILYQLLIRVGGDNWLYIALGVFGIVPLIGLIQNPFTGANWAYVISYLILGTLLRLFIIKKSNN